MSDRNDRKSDRVNCWCGRPESEHTPGTFDKPAHHPDADPPGELRFPCPTCLAKTGKPCVTFANLEMRLFHRTRQARLAHYQERLRQIAEAP